MSRLGVKAARGMQRKLLLESLFKLKFIKEIDLNSIYSEREHLRDFWDRWLNFHNSDEKRRTKYTFEDLNKEEVEEYVKKNLRNLVKNYDRNKDFKLRMKELKTQRMMGIKPLDSINEVLVSESVSEIMTDENKNEISRVNSTKITAKKIERIEFASEFTIKAIEGIISSQEMSQEWLKDYKEAIDCANSGGKYKGKYQFYHLELAAKFKKIALDLADRMEEAIMTGTEMEVKSAQARMNAALKMADMMDRVKQSEFAPVTALNILHEAGERRQKELIGTITNDRQLIELGNIVLKDEKEVVDRDKIRAKLKEHGYSHLQDIMKEELKAVGAVEDIEEEIQNPTIIDAEEDE